jgi:putative nucleotidyltransferase with HDIG domain
MSEVRKSWQPSSKDINNFVFFLISVISVVALWPGDQKNRIAEVSGSAIVVSSCFIVLYLFLKQYSPGVLKVPVKTLFITLLIVSFIILTRIINHYSYRNLVLIIPFVIIPIVVRTFYDARLALFVLLITILLSAFFVSRPFEFAFMTFITGMIALLTLRNIYKRTKIITTSVVVIVSYSIIYTGLNFLVYSNLDQVSSSDFMLFGANGILVLLSYPLIFIFEKKFMFLSDTTLLELSDTNQPLLRKLAEEAPGSFQHSLQVANLAEEAARVTDSHLLLVRAGALYHDIGKIAGPSYFAENQVNGDNPHDSIDPEESAKLIINHVESGVILARNYKLPSQITDFIRTHHGTSVTYFFFRKFTELKPWDTSKEKEFSYPGPKPYSKETAIVMMADAVEASSRSINTKTEENISELVERIIMLQEQDGQYADVPFTFKDISEIKAAFKKRLSTMYHVRMEYPGREGGIFSGSSSTTE